MRYKYCIYFIESEEGVAILKIISKSYAPERILGIFKKYFYLILKRLNFYRFINMLLMLFEVKQRRIRLTSRPIIARINISPICNLRCPACVGKGKHVNSHLMSFEEYRTIIHKIYRHIMFVILYDEGEPLLNQDLYKIIEYTNGLNISSAISTNLSLKLSDMEIKKLVLSGLTKLRVSIDGMTQDIYGKYRVNGKLSLVKSNLEKIIEVKNQYKLISPIIELQFLNFGYNANQLDDAIEYSKYIGVDEFNSYRAELHNLWIAYKGLEKERVNMGCSGLWMTLYVSNDGQLFPCHYGEDNNIDAVGSILNHDLEFLWNSGYMQEMRKSFHRANKKLAWEQCISCPPTEALPFFLR